MRRAAVLMLSLVLVLVGSAPVAAQATRTPFTSTFVFDPEPVDPGTERLTTGRILILRGQVFTASGVLRIGEEEFRPR